MRYTLPTVIITAISLALAGCSNSDSETPSASGEGLEDSMLIGVTTLFPTGTLAEFTEALEAEGPKHNLEFDIQDVSNDAAKEDRLMSVFATRGVDAVMASVVSPTGSIVSIENLNDKDIPVICYNTCLSPPDDEELTTAFVSDDQEGLGMTTGTAAAEYIENELGGQANIAFLTCETYDVCKQRRNGLDEALSTVDANEVASQEAFVVDDATPIATAILTANPELDVFIAENEDAVIAAAAAIETRRRTGETVVFGIGMNPTVAELLLDDNGTVQQVTGQDAKQWALGAIEVALAIRDGEDVGEYYRFTPGPSFEHDNPEAVHDYIDERS